MRCDELRNLLSMYQGESDISTSLITAHIRTCSKCALGVKNLAKAIIEDDALSCDQCRSRFPGYYEVTHLEFPLASMHDRDMAEVAIHLGHCVSCHGEYEMLVLLSQLEEQDDLLK